MFLYQTCFYGQHMFLWAAHVLSHMFLWAAHVLSDCNFQHENNSRLTTVDFIHVWDNK
jgi:hypothetical protein